MSNNQPIDVFITCFLRQVYTEQTLTYLFERTKYPYRLFVINNGGNDEVLDAAKYKIFLRIDLNPNAGVHCAWNIAASMAESKYFITSDNDIYVPDLEPDWLTQMVKFMDDRPDYAAISLCPHIFIGAAGIDPADPEDVKERNMCGAVMRIMDTSKVREVGGWEHVIRTSRNHEERTICSRFQSAGYKVGIASRIRAYHPFGKGIGGNWGYPESVTPEMQGHNPGLKEEVQRFDNPDAYNKRTWLPKI
jgi:glycosyltransferase involved in cell wall biosynthesis